MKKSLCRLALTASAIPFLGLSSVAYAQTAADEDAAAEDNGAVDPGIIVTGSSIKGVAPVGSNLTTVGRDELEDSGAQTIQQVLKSVPSVVGLQSAGQGSYGSFDGAGTNAPTIHGLGASASNSTLILLNGHRLPVSGINHVLADPNIVAPLALERVEVLADGASSVYGSDAVAGVINFITRKNYDGFEASIQKGFGKQYGTISGGVLGGKKWDTGSFLISYNYSDRDNLAAKDRIFARANQSARGGRNFQTTLNRCSPASITSAGVTYYTPYTSGGVVAGDCDPSVYWDIVPSEQRHNVFATMNQEVAERLTLTADFIYGYRKNVQQVTRGSGSGTIYRTGSVPPAGRSINPYTGQLASLPGAPTSATVNFNADQLLGSGATITGTAETFYGRLDAEYEINDKWNFNAGALVGLDTAKQVNVGQLNVAAFNLALNGFTSAAINGVTQTVSQALTTANAIDVFGSGTSAATMAALTDNRILQVGDQTIKNFYAKVDGDLFELPGGAAKVALGGEITNYKLAQDIVRGNNLGIASANSTNTHINYRRQVKSGYVELFLPLIADSFVKSFDLNISGRIDDYSDFGSTKNPKIAANLEIVEGVKFRGNWAKSFVAPALTSRGANAQGLTGESGFSGINGGGIPGGSPTISIANFPTIASVPGAVCTATTCTIGTVNGVLITGGNGNLKPQRGKAFSFGVDLTTPSGDPLQARLSVTYWSNKLRGGITAPQGALALGAADLSYLLTVAPAGLTAAQIAAAGAGLPQTGVISSPAYFIYNFQQNNVLNLNVTGIDVASALQYETGFGKVKLGAAYTRKLKFDQFFGASGTKFSVLGTAGFNTTFPSLETEARLNAGLETGAFDVNVFYNHLGGYRNWSGTVANAVVRTNGVPTGGGDLVKSFGTIDLNMSYKLQNMGPLSEAQIFFDATNLFDKAPPQYNTFVTNAAAGYDPINASPIGRVITIGLRTKF